MADKPRFVDPFLTQQKPANAQEAPPPSPKAPSARGRSTESTASTSPPAATASFEAPSVAEPPVTGELIERPTAAPSRRRRQLAQEKHRELVRKVDDKLRMRTANIASWAFDFNKVLRPEEAGGEVLPKPEGWSEQHYRTALDARLPDKDAPAGLRHAMRILESFRRSEALESDGRPAPVLNCDIQVVMKQEVTYRYETIEAKED